MDLFDATCKLNPQPILVGPGRSVEICHERLRATK